MARSRADDDMPEALEKLQYPIGRFIVPTFVTAVDRAKWLQAMADAPAQLRASVAGLDDEQLDTSYRPGGWTVRQVIHHLADSHLNSYVRIRLALTEEHPTIRPYDENLWAKLGDAKSAPVGVSLDLLDALHRRWLALLGKLSPAEWRRTYFHPETGEMVLEVVLALYAWHGRHHAAHITSLREREGW